MQCVCIKKLTLTEMEIEAPEAPVVVTKPKIDIDPALLSELQTQVHESGQVVVHCIQNSKEPSFIRRPSTFLFDHHSEHFSFLVCAENISYFPKWKLLVEETPISP